jgi:cytochrome c
MMLRLLQVSTPVPRDIPLDLPLPEWLLIVLLIVSFLLHIIFVNLMLGSTVLTLWCQIKGLKDQDYHQLAHEISRTITVNKSLAVVLGVAPLLSISTLYATHFYSATSLTGGMWIAVIPLVTVAFLLTYLNKYTWKILDKNKPLSIAINAAATALFLFIPLIFLVNVNLMLFPEKWGTVKGFFSALLLPNVLPRYLHFIAASMAVTGLFIFWYMGRKNYPFETYFASLTRYEVRKNAYSLTLAASVAQFIIGPLVMLTLPTKGFDWRLVLVILSGAAIALPAMWQIWKAISGTPENIDRHFGAVVIALTITVVFMGSGRHVYRANALAPHQKLMAANTAEFQRLSKEARENPVVEEELKPDSSLGADTRGAAVFKQNCSSCHQEKTKLVGPPMTEMAAIYANDKNGLKQWIKSPGKKRPGYPQMPAFSQLSDVDREELANYILIIKK